MELKTENTVDGGLITYSGSLSAQNVIVMVGRTNFLKDEALVHSIFQAFNAPNLLIACYEHEGMKTVKQIGRITARFMEKHKRFFSFLEKRTKGKISASFVEKCLLKPLSVLWFPKQWDYFFLTYSGSNEIISYQEKRLRRFIKSLGPNRNIVLLSRSAGGRVAVRLEDEPTVKKNICLGYPFKDPEKSEQTFRTEPLATLKKPFHVIQGRQDAYGGEDILDRYVFSSLFTISFVEADHNFLVSAEDWQTVVSEIKQFCIFDD